MTLFSHLTPTGNEPIGLSQYRLTAGMEIGMGVGFLSDMRICLAGKCEGCADVSGGVGLRLFWIEGSVGSLVYG